MSLYKIDISAPDIKTQIQKTFFERIEVYQDNFVKESIPYISCYSSDMERELVIIEEKFYDQIASIISSFDPNKKNETISLFNAEKSIYLTSMYNLIKKYKPEIHPDRLNMLTSLKQIFKRINNFDYS
jgi:plasmid replication initiation protein